MREPYNADVIAVGVDRLTLFEPFLLISGQMRTRDEISSARGLFHRKQAVGFEFRREHPIPDKEFASIGIHLFYLLIE